VEGVRGFGWGRTAVSGVTAALLAALVSYGWWATTGSNLGLWGAATTVVGSGVAATALNRIVVPALWRRWRRG
jgi:hypothetical protein